MKHSDWFRIGVKGIQRSSKKREITRIYACTPIKAYTSGLPLFNAYTGAQVNDLF
jgi:hypothetical protein